MGLRVLEGLRGLCAVVVMLTSIRSVAFESVPAESAKALMVTRGKPFTAGAVFVNGKYLLPPYVVERWGTGIRINGTPVTGQVIDWNEFLKTQAGVKVVKSEPAVEATASSEPAPAATEDVNSGSLDDLFDDDPKPKNAVARKPAAAAKPKQTTVYSVDGAFVPNEATKAMVARINALRTEIDRTLRSGGFICFGDSYSQVTGDARSLLDFLEKVSESQRNASDAQDFCERIRSAGLVYLNEVLRMDLYRNRVDYRKLQELRTKLKMDSEMQRLLDRVSSPLF